jgi:hypothetical protein
VIPYDNENQGTLDSVTQKTQLTDSVNSQNHYTLTGIQNIMKFRGDSDVMVLGETCWNNKEGYH